MKMKSPVLLLTLCALCGIVVSDRDYTGCPPGVPEVQCLIDPCDEPNAGCYNIRGAVCRAYYCGGCKRRWYVGRREVTRFCRPGYNGRGVMES